MMTKDKTVASMPTGTDRTRRLIRALAFFGVLMSLAEIPWLVASWRSGHLLFIGSAALHHPLKHLVGVTLMWPLSIGISATVFLNTGKS